MKACRIMRENLTYKVTVRSMGKEARTCVRENGGHFEGLSWFEMSICFIELLSLVYIVESALILWEIKCKTR